jgi:hypothetical protein
VIASTFYEALCFVLFPKEVELNEMEAHHSSVKTHKDQKTKISWILFCATAQSNLKFSSEKKNLDDERWSRTQSNYS